MPRTSDPPTDNTDNTDDTDHTDDTEEKPPLDTSRPFRRADFIDAGHRARLLRGVGYRRVCRGVYVDASVPDSPALRAQASLLFFEENAWASHASAARVYGLPIPALPGEHVTVHAHGQRRGHDGITVHLTKGGWVRVLDDARISHPLQLFLELAGQVNLVDLVVVGDAMVKRDLVTLAELVDFCATSRSRHARLARRAASHVRERVDSPMESRLRMLIVLAGLPEPQVNLTFEDALGFPTRRHDLSWPDLKLIVEYDGRHHVERVEQWESDLDRRESIDADDWRIIVVVAAGIYKHPEQTLTRIQAALKKAGARGLPAQLSGEWRSYFPGKA